MPEFPGGDQQLLNFLSQNTRYPKIEQDSGIQGKVLLRFMIEKDGSVSEVTVIRGVSAGLNAEAVRVVNSFPCFIPARNYKGEPVHMYFNLPFVFKPEN